MAEADDPLTVRPAGPTDEELLRAVAQSRSWRGVSRALGMRSAAQGRQFKARCDAVGIDYRHFGSRTWDDSDLECAVDQARSWTELMQALGYLTHSGSARATIRKHALRLNLDLSRFNAPPARAGEDPFACPADLQHLRAAGAYVVAGACALLGHKVSWPLEPALYDLVVEAGGQLYRVQVKTTSWRLDGAWACKITRRQRGEKAWYTKEDIDYFGVVDGQMRVYMIPVEVVDGTGTIVVRHYEAYRLRPPGACEAERKPEPLG